MYRYLRRHLVQNVHPQIWWQSGVTIRLILSQDVHFFYARYHLSALQSCALIHQKVSET